MSEQFCHFGNRKRNKVDTWDACGLNTEGEGRNAEFHQEQDDGVEEYQEKTSAIHASSGFAGRNTKIVFRVHKPRRKSYMV